MKRKKKFKKQISKRKILLAAIGVVSSLALAFVTVAAIAYQNGVYDIVFIERPSESTDTADTTDTTETDDLVSDTEPEPESETAAITETSAEPVTEATPPEDTTVIEDTSTVEPVTTEVPTEPVSPDLNSDEKKLKAYIASLDNASELSENGLTVSDDEYTSDFVFGIVNAELTLGEQYSLRNRPIYTHERVQKDSRDVSKGFTVEHTVTGEEARPLVDVYMDYIIVDKGDTCSLLNSDGTVLVADFDIEYYVPAYTRDKSGNALFVAKEQSRYNPKNTITQYYYVNKNGEFKISYYNDVTDNRGIYVNYPADYAESDSNYSIQYNTETGLFGYKDNTAEEVAPEDYRYIAAYNHSNGLAVAVETDGFLYILDDYYDEENSVMKTFISAEYEFYQKPTNRRLLRHLLLHKTFGEESLGYLYFDHGLLRVRAQVVDAWHWQQYGNRKVNSDTDILLREDGSEFHIPTDYKLVSYSNGVLLLEKDGFCGYMDYTGKWILDPIYTYAKPFYEGLAVVGNEGEIGMIDTNGNFVISPFFDYISSASCGTFTAYDDECGWIIFNKMA